VKSDKDDIPHAIASTTKAFGSKLVDCNRKLSFASATASVYAHFCSLPPHMSGTTVVEAAAGRDRAP
jgi:hypothetical protein